MSTPTKLRAKFFKDDDTGLDMLEISWIGEGQTLIRKVTPEDVAKFPLEWQAHENGKGEVEIKGTSLLEVPGIDKGMAMALRLKGVRTAEELAGLDEASAKSLGMGVFTFGKAARNLLAAKRLEALEALQAEAPKRRRAEADQPAA
jgi:hypothetical protein